MFRYRLCEEAGMKTSWVLTEKPVPAESTSNKRKHKGTFEEEN